MKIKEVPIDALERIFHEPHRLGILSVLCASKDPISFPDLQKQCNLSAGNLNRHLFALEDVVRIKKTFVNRRPRTTITITSRGIDRFQQYVDALGTALKRVRQSVPSAPSPSWLGAGKKTTA